VFVAKDGGSGTCRQVPCESDPKCKGEVWKDDSRVLREELNISMNYKPWSSQHDVRMSGVPENARMRDCIELAWAFRLAKTRGRLSPMDARKGFFVDIAQAVKRKPWGGPKTMTQGHHPQECSIPVRFIDGFCLSVFIGGYRLRQGSSDFILTCGRLVYMSAWQSYQSHPAGCWHRRTSVETLRL
jgi:hypothetical protein